MDDRRRQPYSAGTLRAELSLRNLARAEGRPHEVTFGALPSVVYDEETGGHGNFLAASYRRICADQSWRRRLEKSYTASARVPRSGDRWRGELECASSSDALLMNVFCYPRLLCRPAVCALLGVASGLRPEFGVRAHLPMRRGEIDRTEVDLRLGSLLVEAKLTEGGFGRASRERLLRYEGAEAAFDLELLPWGAGGVAGYQLIRGVLAAEAQQGSFLLLCDGRRRDLQEMWFSVARAVRGCERRNRLSLLTWQELASTVPRTLQTFLREKYGILAA